METEEPKPETKQKKKPAPVYSDEYCDTCECDPCDCNWGTDQ